MKKLILILALSVPLAAQPHKHFNFKAELPHLIHLGSAVADVETTQHCLASKTCYEANPLMPSSRVGAYSVDLGFVGFAWLLSHQMHKQHSRFWWEPPAVGTATHLTGVAVTLERTGK